MKSPATIALLTAVAVATLTNTAPAMAAQAFMKVQGAPGPVHRDGEPGWFKADKFTWGSLTNPSPGNKPPRSGSGSFSFTKSMDSATTGLMKYCVQGLHIPQIKIEWYRTSPKASTKVIVYNILMTECPDTDMPAPETYSMEFSNIKWEYKKQKKDKELKGFGPGK